MTIRTAFGILGGCLLLLANGPCRARELLGRVGRSGDAGWIDLESPVDFVRGDRLRLLVAGTAHTILVRAAPVGASHDEPTGLLGERFDVPANHVVEVSLRDARRGIDHLSVHGGPAPWHIPLGLGNGGIELIRVELVNEP